MGRLYADALFNISEIPSNLELSQEGRLSRNDYYRSLQECRIVLSLPGNGNDTFRFRENAACNAVHVSPKVPLYTPNNFVEEKQIFRFINIEKLKRIVGNILDSVVKSDEIIQEGRNHLIKFHLSTKRARYFLDRIEKAFAK
ncbi:MAG TPA: glycosyltransferase [Nitrospinota bacterium]|nr:glycosyltransferase [Nitrospinota bacterium]|tara:strand:- start:314 stop:739 length:426 start_codon:yes stop_codon:yes gene_type:complete